MTKRRALPEPRRENAAAALAAMDPQVWIDNAGRFTCGEAETVADFLRQWRTAAVADQFLDHHAAEDQVYDDHYGRAHWENNNKHPNAHSPSVRKVKRQERAQERAENARPTPKEARTE